jgi:hypothetical protein
MATWEVAGTICFNVSSHLPNIDSSALENPVTLPPGRARLSIQPTPTGSRLPGR